MRRAQIVKVNLSGPLGAMATAAPQGRHALPGAEKHITPTSVALVLCVHVHERLAVQRMWHE